MFKNDKSNGKTTVRNATHPLTAHRWEDGHEYIVYLEEDARGIFREVAAVPVQKAESLTIHPAATVNTVKPVPAQI